MCCFQPRFVFGVHVQAIRSRKRTIDISDRVSVRKTCVRHDWRSVNPVWTDKYNMSVVSYAGSCQIRCTNLLFLPFTYKFIFLFFEQLSIPFGLLSTCWKEKLLIVQIFRICYRYINNRNKKMSQTFTSILLRITVALIRLRLIVYDVFQV